MATAKRAIALGFFDGVHIGHAALLSRTLDISAKSALTPAVITFDVLPQNLVIARERSDRGNLIVPKAEPPLIPLINSREDKIGLISRLFGIDDVIFLHFDKAMSAMPWDDFVDMLIADYGARHLVAGSNFRFGSGAAGDCELLRKKCADKGIGCEIIPDVLQGGIVVSSTYIREMLQGGQIERANEFLGHPHVLTDIVRSGQKLGRNLGAPTLNMRFPPDVLIPAFGVYATKVYHGEGDGSESDGNKHIGVTNVGIRPTFDDGSGKQNVTAETYMPGYEGNLYGKQVRVEFHNYLRPEMKFDSVEELKAQIKRDSATAIERFEH